MTSELPVQSDWPAHLDNFARQMASIAYDRPDDEQLLAVVRVLQGLSQAVALGDAELVLRQAKPFAAYLKGKKEDPRRPQHEDAEELCQVMGRFLEDEPKRAERRAQGHATCARRASLLAEAYGPDTAEGKAVLEDGKTASEDFRPELPQDVLARWFTRFLCHPNMGALRETLRQTVMPERAPTTEQIQRVSDAFVRLLPSDQRPSRERDPEKWVKAGLRALGCEENMVRGLYEYRSRRSERGRDA